MFVLRLTEWEKTTLWKLLNVRVKEVHAWQVATKSRRRGEEYEHLAALLRKITSVEES